MKIEIKGTPGYVTETETLTIEAPPPNSYSASFGAPCIVIRVSGQEIAVSLLELYGALSGIVEANRAAALPSQPLWQVPAPFWEVRPDGMPTYTIG